jgi:hypothetical protein
MLKLVTLILKPRYSHKKQLKIDYETQFSTDPMLNDKIDQLNKRYKKQPELTQGNPLSIIFVS